MCPGDLQASGFGEASLAIEITLDCHSLRVAAAGRAATLIIGVLLSALAVVSDRVISFVGLAAPHMARMLLGAVLVSVSDTLGRTVLAPAQLLAGLVVVVLAPTISALVAEALHPQLSRRLSKAW